MTEKLLTGTLSLNTNKQKHYPTVKPPFSNFRVITANFSCVQMFSIFTVYRIRAQTKLDLGGPCGRVVKDAYLYRALNQASSHNCGFEPSSGHM